MFGLISKKKYTELETKYNELRNTYEGSIYTTAILERSKSILEMENKSIRKEITHWKQMYADEVQKRIDLCEKLKQN